MCRQHTFRISTVQRGVYKPKILQLVPALCRRDIRVRLCGGKHRRDIECATDLRLRINRLQRGQWLKLFAANNFELHEEHSTKTDISRLNLAERYRSANTADLECTVVRVALKTASADAAHSR